MNMSLRDWGVPIAAVLAGMWIAAGQADTAAGAGSTRAAMAEARKQDALKQTWQRRYEQALARIASAEARIAEATKTMRKLRDRKRWQGPDRDEITAEISSAKRDLETARRDVAEFPDAARQAGIPPGWLREVEERRAREG